jgi:hypothetical protein
MWEFDPSLGTSRIRELSKPPSFDSVVEQIAREMKILCCDPDPAKEAPDKGISRIVFCVQVAPRLFDLFFNSEKGFRAAYYESPERGLEAERKFISVVMPKLLESGERNCKQWDREFAEKSLTKDSAKVWLAERGKGLCAKCSGEYGHAQNNRAEIRNRRWESVVGPHADAKNGRKAPYLTKLRIFGAFLYENLKVWDPPKKQDRAKQIHEFGWTWESAPQSDVAQSSEIVP